MHDNGTSNGGAGATLGNSWQVLGGRYYNNRQEGIGGAGTNAVINGITVGSREHFESMTRAIEANGIKPVIDQRFPLAETRAAFESMKPGSHFGKIVVTM